MAPKIQIFRSFWRQNVKIFKKMDKKYVMRSKVVILSTVQCGTLFVEWWFHQLTLGKIATNWRMKKFIFQKNGVQKFAIFEFWLCQYFYFSKMLAPKIKKILNFWRQKFKFSEVLAPKIPDFKNVVPIFLMRQFVVIFPTVQLRRTDECPDHSATSF